MLILLQLVMEMTWSIEKKAMLFDSMLTEHRDFDNHPAISETVWGCHFTVNKFFLVVNSSK